jgi:hypothetical protein
MLRQGPRILAKRKAARKHNGSSNDAAQHDLAAGSDLDEPERSIWQSFAEWRTV